jgi:CSLREA domain-containing protein
MIIGDLRAGAGLMAVIGASGFVLFGPGSAAYATTITVNTVQDELNADGNCSLREAIQAANTDSAVDGCAAGSGADTIVLAAGTYTLSIVGRDENASASGDLDITSNLTVNGGAATSTIIDGAGLDRVFHIGPGVTAGISGMTIQNGNLGAAGPGAGGGVGIFNDSGSTLTLTDITVSGNTGGTGGAGLTNSGTLLTLVNSTVSGNSTGGPGGGGILNGFGSTLSVVKSTISGNTSGAGGGILNDGGTVIMTNSAVSGNTVTGIEGGGIWQAFPGTGSLTVNSSTIANNSAASGGGIKVSAGTATLKNTIVANSPGGGNCNGPISSAGHNLSRDSSCPFSSSGDLNNTNPLLGPLEVSGGTTATHTLLASSPAIDAGSGDCPPPATDQRGIARPQGAACDIGASEVYSFNGFFQPVDNLPVFNLVKAGSGVPVKFSLGGFKGLAIFAAGFPQSTKVDCSTTAPQDNIEQTLTAGGSSLSFDASLDQYTYALKTDKAWASTCRKLEVKLIDGRTYGANFKFK